MSRVTADDVSSPSTVLILLEACYFLCVHRRYSGPAALTTLGLLFLRPTSAGDVSSSAGQQGACMLARPSSLLTSRAIRKACSQQSPAEELCVRSGYQ